MSSVRSQVERWERALSVLDDAVFLDLAKNFIGKIPTPFHKPQITDRLTTLFSSSEFLDQLEARLSKLDRRILAGAVLLGSASQDELCSIFMGEHDYVHLQQNVVNLEERLLLVPDPDATSLALMINPLVAHRLIHRSLRLTDLVPSPMMTNDDLPFSVVPVDRRIIRALASLHIHGSLGNQERSERLLASRYAQPVFGASDASQLERLYTYDRLLFQEQAIRIKGKRTSVDVHAIAHLLALDEHQLRWLLFQASWERVMKRSDIRSLRLWFDTFLLLLEHIPVFDESGLARLCTLALLRTGLRVEDLGQLIGILRAAGIGVYPPASPENGKVIAMQPQLDSDLTISFTEDVPPVSHDDILHVIALVRKVDVVTTYEIHKSTILRAFDSNLSVQIILRYLDGLTHKVPEHLKRLIHQWHDEFNAIAIYDGILVKTDDRLGRIITALPALQEHLVTMIDEHIFLFNRDTEPQWRDILADTGIGVLPSSIGSRPVTESIVHEEGPHLDADFSSQELRRDLELLAKSEGPCSTEDADFTKHLRSAIMERELKAPEREELLARLERKLILVPSQISASDGRTQTMEASGFDYQGKVNLSKSAVNSPHVLLELHILDDDGETQVYLSEVKEFIKDAKDSAIRVRLLPHGEEKVIPIGKVFRMRKLRRSIFFQA